MFTVGCVEMCDIVTGVITLPLHRVICHVGECFLWVVVCAMLIVVMCLVCGSVWCEIVLFLKG